jgi:ABC-type multidrug transport system ATPase subunit
MVFGLSPDRDRDRIKEFLGVQLQESALPPRIRVGEAVRLFASFYANPFDPGELLESLEIKQIAGSALTTSISKADGVGGSFRNANPIEIAGLPVSL